MEDLVAIMSENTNHLPKRYADAIVSFLKEKGIRHIFDLSGGMIAYLEDAISVSEGIECVPMHHEQAAGFAAEGYARVSNNFGVAIATSGPGATNLITAIGSTFFDSVPTLFIVGYVNTNNIKKNDDVRQEGFQELDIVSMVKPITKYAKLIKSANDIIYELEKAYSIMMKGRPGSVLLAIPIDLQRTELPDTVSHFIGSPEQVQLERDVDFEAEESAQNYLKLEELLKVSKAPLVLVGHGITLAKATEELADFLQRTNLPVVQSLMGLDTCPYSENTWGYIGVNGNRLSNIAFSNADLIIVLGARLDVRQTGDERFFNPRAKVVHVDIDISNLNYRIKADISICADLKSFFKKTRHIKIERKTAWFAAINSAREYVARELVYSNGLSDNHTLTVSYVDPNTFIDELSQAAPAQAIISVDVGQNQMWTAQSWKVKKGQRILFSGGMGAMGFALPAIIGAYMVDRTKQPIAICGDGGLQISLQELETVTRNKIPLKYFILNNNTLGMVKEFQDLYFNHNYQSTVIGYGVPNLKLLAQTYGLEYVKIENLQHNDEVIRQIINNPNATLVEVSIDLHASVTPRVVFGHSLDDQAPYLTEDKKMLLKDIFLSIN